jgi:hypothetical protein
MVNEERSSSVCTPRSGTYTLTIVSICSHEHVVSVRNVKSPCASRLAPKPNGASCGGGPPR